MVGLFTQGLRSYAAKSHNRTGKLGSCLSRIQFSIFKNPIHISANFIMTSGHKSVTTLAMFDPINVLQTAHWNLFICLDVHGIGRKFNFNLDCQMETKQIIIKDLYKYPLVALNYIHNPLNSTQMCQLSRQSNRECLFVCQIQ